MVRLIANLSMIDMFTSIQLIVVPSHYGPRGPGWSVARVSLRIMPEMLETAFFHVTDYVIIIYLLPDGYGMIVKYYNLLLLALHQVRL